MSNKCPTCKGSGEVEIQNPVRVHTTIKEVCPTCHGSGLHGYVHGQHMPCTDCRGTGLGSSPESPQTHVVTEGLAAGTDELRPDTKQNETKEFETELKQLVMDVSVASTADNIRQSKARGMINRAIDRTRVAHQSALAVAYESGRAEGWEAGKRASEHEAYEHERNKMAEYIKELSHPAIQITRKEKT